jgi:hypothetical protein
MIKTPDLWEQDSFGLDRVSVKKQGSWDNFFDGLLFYGAVLWYNLIKVIIHPSQMAFGDNCIRDHLAG